MIHARCISSEGEILITQDADDIPHPQKIEATEYFFSHYDVDHLIHTWKPSSKHNSATRAKSHAQQA